MEPSADLGLKDKLIEVEPTLSLPVAQPCNRYDSISRQDLLNAWSGFIIQSDRAAEAVDREKYRRNIIDSWDHYITAAAQSVDLSSLSKIAENYSNIREILAGWGLVVHGRLPRSDEERAVVKSERTGMWLDKLVGPLMGLCGVEPPAGGYNFQLLVNRVCARSVKQTLLEAKRLSASLENACVKLERAYERLELAQRMVLRAESSGMFVDGIFSRLEDCAEAYAAAHNGLIDVLNTKTDPHFLRRFKAAQSEFDKAVTHTFGAREALEELSFNMCILREPSKECLHAWQKQAEAEVTRLFGDKNNSFPPQGMSLPKLISEFMEIDYHANNTLSRPHGETLGQFLSTLAHRYLDRVLEYPEESIRAIIQELDTPARFKSSQRLAELMKVIEIESQAEVQQSLANPVWVRTPKQKQAPQSDSKSDPNVTRRLLREYQIPPDLALQLSRGLDSAKLSERESVIGEIFGSATRMVIRRHAELLRQSDQHLAEHADTARQLFLNRDKLDPEGIISALDPQSNIKGFLPGALTEVSSLLNDLTAARNRLSEYRPLHESNADKVWTEFIRGFDQIFQTGGRRSADETAQRVTQVKFPRKFPPDICEIAVRKLASVCAAQTLDQIRKIPGNKLEIFMRSDPNNPIYVIRVNSLWRVGFKFNAGQAEEVNLVNYH